MKVVKTSQVLGLMVVLAGMTPASVRAEEAAAEPAATAAAAVDVASAYVFRGETFNDDVNVQPTLSGSFGMLSLGTWGNLNTDSSNFDEIDYFASVALPLGEEFPIGLSVGYTEYTYPTAVTEPVADEAVVCLEADREVNVIASHDLAVNDETTLGLSLAGNFGLEGPYLDQGINVTADASVDFAATDEVGISGGVTVGSEWGDNKPDDGISYAQLNLGASYAMLYGAIHYVIETDDDVLVIDEDLWGSVGLSLPL